MVIEFSCKIFFAIIFVYLGIIQLRLHLGLNTYNYKNQFINLCLLLSVLLIISQTLFPIRTNTPLSSFEVYNLIPFKVIIDIYNNLNYHLTMTHKFPQLPKILRPLYSNNHQLLQIDFQHQLHLLKTPIACQLMLHRNNQ